MATVPALIASDGHLGTDGVEGNIGRPSDEG